MICCESSAGNVRPSYHASYIMLQLFRTVQTLLSSAKAQKAMGKIISWFYLKHGTVNSLPYLQTQTSEEGDLTAFTLHCKPESIIKPVMPNMYPF